MKAPRTVTLLALILLVGGGAILLLAFIAYMISPSVSAGDKIIMGALTSAILGLVLLVAGGGKTE